MCIRDRGGTRFGRFGLRRRRFRRPIRFDRYLRSAGPPRGAPPRRTPLEKRLRRARRPASFADSGSARTNSQNPPLESFGDLV
eukprot:8268416-Alexandrium_andersonii.AAC.1